MSEFSTKMMGLAYLMLGIKITHHPNSITLSQSHYINSLLDLYGIPECKPMATPLIPNPHLEAASDLERVAFLSLNINFCSAIESLRYLSTATRPDLSFLEPTPLNSPMVDTARGLQQPTPMWIGETVTCPVVRSQDISSFGKQENSRLFPHHPLKLSIKH
ncbi:hypothetical protein O181_002903 [Austropuccinia psidii MF-1]|uniref:Reverse transcriptase Ty1/copia-type domain-containing protein n=1 Tax=Austropuccinia psidii MF-1 TaxID=1389203 RepID=A0A9Q3BDE2_9BASI|nr:hypothetical protein [Austropuccinia psidii MF-1]